MEKRISYDQFQSVKRVAQACNHLMMKRNKLKAQIEKLAAEYRDYDTQIAAFEAGIKNVVGFRVEQLVQKVIEPGVDVNGQPKKTTKYLPTDIVSYDETKKQFIITIPDSENKQPAAPEQPSAEEQSSSSVPGTDASNSETEPVFDPEGDNEEIPGTGDEEPADAAFPADAPIFD